MSLIARHWGLHPLEYKVPKLNLCGKQGDQFIMKYNIPLVKTVNLYSITTSCTKHYNTVEDNSSLLDPT